MKKTAAAKKKAAGKVRVAIVGAGGYGGVGAIELLLRHPGAELVRLLDVADTGKPFSALYPHLRGFCDLPITPADDPGKFDGVDVVLFSTPDGVGQKDAGEWLKHGVKVIDYSGDFRFDDANVYAEYASRIGRKDPHASPALLEKSAYGVPELHRTEIRKAQIVGNPGCFAVCTELGLAPAVREGLIDLSHIVCDGKTGVSGAGKKPTPGFHYPARYDNTSAYKVSGHQHVFEIERELSLLADKPVKITFTPHVVPMARGILVTIYAPLKRASADDLLAAYKEFYGKERFVRVFDKGDATATCHVRGSNFVNVWVNADPRTDYAVIVSHIDNLVKGQAGSAIQNLNVMSGIEETLGLDHAGTYP